MNNEYFRSFLDNDVKEMINKFKNNQLAEDLRSCGMLYLTIMGSKE